MPSVVAVIGAGFGDEGKGLMTDYFASKIGANCVVVRQNGGAQAAHTVVTPDGLRHVFSHIGSGTYAGCDTHLSKYFIVNPVIYRIERKEILPTNISADPRCLVTTPYEMVINQLIERKRGKDRHGSCGVGINETIRRHNAIPVTVQELNDPGALTSLLKKIRDVYVPKRLAELGITDCDIKSDQSFVLKNDRTVEKFLDEVELFLDDCAIIQDEYTLPGKDIIFEGAQGLLLDQDHEYFPYVTHSKTGLDNVVKICRSCGIDEIEVCYVTRCYLTRHGVGPLPGEVPGKPYEGIEDPTNISNEWQGSLRFGLLNLDILMGTIWNDLSNHIDISVIPNLAMTCLDHLPGYPNGYKMRYILSQEEGESTAYDMAKTLSKAFNAVYTSSGPTRENIRIL